MRPEVLAGLQLENKTKGQDKLITMNKIIFWRVNSTPHDFNLPYIKNKPTFK